MSIVFLYLLVLMLFSLLPLSAPCVLFYVTNNNYFQYYSETQISHAHRFFSDFLLFYFYLVVEINLALSDHILSYHIVSY